MRNMVEYLRWRGDISFRLLPVCEADYLVFSQLAYIPFEGIVEESFTPSLTLGQAAKKVLDEINKKGGKYLFFLAENVSLLKEIINSPRYSELYVCAHVNIINHKKQEQFSAITFIIPDHGDPGNNACVVAFRGTDSTVIGWKEDLNMAFSKAVPSQLDAVRYLERVSAAFPLQRLFVCGHSKGGNLAVYSSAFCDRDVQENIAAVRNLDGPGFSEEIIISEAFRRIMDRTETVVPSSSIVGILFEHAEEFTVIRSYSNSAGLQHNPFTWELDRGGYVTVEKITGASMYIDDTLTRWLASMPDEMREKLVNGIYTLITSSGEDDIRNVFKPKNVISVLKTLSRLDPETAKVLKQALVLFNSAADNNLPKFIDKLVRSSRQADNEIRKK